MIRFMRTPSVENALQRIVKNLSQVIVLFLNIVDSIVLFLRSFEFVIHTACLVCGSVETIYRPSINVSTFFTIILSLYPQSFENSDFYGLSASKYLF